jgi:pimeloyl-ACP methyl ester carboxylesterase
MKPVLLLIPGMLNTAAIWSRVTPLIGDAADVRIASMLTQSTIPEMSDDAWKRVADVKPGTPLVICGFSMGGYTAIEMLTHASERAREVTALALLDTSGRPESPEGRVVREKTIAAIEKNFPKVVEGVLSFGTSPVAQADEALMQAMRQIMLDVGPETAIRQNRAIMARADSREKLAALKIKTLVICGREDKITPPEVSTELAGLIPGAELEWIDSAGHMTPMEQPERLASLLRTLL